MTDDERINNIQKYLNMLKTNMSIETADKLLLDAYSLMMSINHEHIPKIAYPMFAMKRKQYILDDLDTIAVRNPTKRYAKTYQHLSQEDKNKIADLVIEKYLPADKDCMNYMSQADTEYALRKIIETPDSLKLI